MPHKELEKCKATLSTFWQRFRAAYDDNTIFQDVGQADLALTVPIKVHGDEGRSTLAAFVLVLFFCTPLCVLSLSRFLCSFLAAQNFSIEKFCAALFCLHPFLSFCSFLAGLRIVVIMVIMCTGMQSLPGRLHMDQMFSR